MMDGKTEWPQSLKDFANRVFTSCTESNRKAASEELRAIIFEAFQAGTIHSTDWSNVQLKALGRAGPAGSPASKKGKKRLIGGSGADLLSTEDDDKKEKRARRFENDQRAYEQDREQEWSDALGNTSLAGRFGPSPVSHNGMSTAPPQSSGAGWTYDAMPAAGPSRIAAANNSWSRLGTSTPPMAMSGAFDESIADPNVIDWDKDTVVGLSTKLEKPYLRLTSAPDPKTVRPLPILQQTLELLKRKWRAENNYTYVCDQFKSMRQDLTVQRIKNDFTVKVYEIHARIALEKGDLGEYNQCQSQLRTLYAYGLPGCPMEFLAYRILYLLHTRNRREVNALMSELTTASKNTPAVAHALSVRLAIATGNYHHFFKLYMDAPNMNAYIMDHFIERERVVALSVMARAYRPSLPLSYLSSELAFNDLQEAHEFLNANNIAIYIEPTPAEAAALAATQAEVSGSGKSKKKKSHATPAPATVPLEQRKWDCKNALPGVIAAGDRFRKIDIKGQI